MQNGRACSHRLIKAGKIQLEKLAATADQASPLYGALLGKYDSTAPQRALRDPQEALSLQLAVGGGKATQSMLLPLATCHRVQPSLPEDSMILWSQGGAGQRASSSSVLFVTALLRHDSTVTAPCSWLQEFQLRVSKHQLLPAVATTATPAGSTLAFLPCWRQKATYQSMPL